MDVIISSALEQICLQGRDGLALSSLCSKLGLSIEHKQAFWNNLLKIPALQFQVLNHVYDPIDPSIQCFEDAEKVDLVIVAKGKLHDNFLGIYDFFLGAKEKERIALERIAYARTNGITQSQLSKELGIKGNNIFYEIKTLEKRGLIVRQDAIDRTRGCDKQGQFTRLIHLYRYARHLGSQENFEITKGEETRGDENDLNIEHVKEDVHVKDFLPEMKAICDKLEEANAKVLVISDIKHDLGYLGRRSRRRWEKICGRLKTAGLVEETSVKVNGKIERCLHSLKKFSQMDFQQTKSRSFKGTELKGRKSQIANLFVELPIEQQIYDTINASGSEGILMKEVGKRFGIEAGKRLGTDTNTNKNDKMICKFGMHTQKELHNKTSEIRIWTARNFKSNEIPSRSQDIIHKEKAVFSNSVVHVAMVAMTVKPCQYLTVDSTRREQSILEWLKVEKIVLKAELYRWLVNLEKEKGTTMCRKTVDRILHKLESQGQCKCIKLAVIKITPTNVNHKVEVVLHPSIQSSSSEVLVTVRDRLISFEKKNHGQGSLQKKNIGSVLALDCVQRTQRRFYSQTQGKEDMRANEFILGKMVRAKLLHYCLWDYACSISARDDVLSYQRQDHDLQNPHVTRYFDVEAAIKGISLEFFLKIVGSTVKVDNMIEKLNKGVRLCDLHIQEYNNFNATPARKRLLSIIAILERLKLIRLVYREAVDSGVSALHASPMYALELKPYIEEPPLIVNYSNSESLDLYPDRDVACETIRHDFVLSNRDAVDEYWHVLEYIYAVADPNVAVHAFPGSALTREIFSHKSWTSGQRMTTDQHAKVLKLIKKSSFYEKLPYNECKEIAKSINLTLEQVLRVYYAKIRRQNKFKDKLKVVAVGAECLPNNSHYFPRKRKRSAITMASNQAGSATKISRCLSEHGSDFSRGGVELTADLRRKESCHLFSLVCSGEMFISPCVPIEGVGETKYLKNSKGNENRREKGFDGIKVLLHRAPARDVSSFMDGETCGADNGHDMPEGYKVYKDDCTIMKNICKKRISQAFRIVMENPGILEDDIICKMDPLNHQHCKKLLSLMVRGNYLIVKKKKNYQGTCGKVPALLEVLTGGSKFTSKESEPIYREHFFVNTMNPSGIAEFI